MSTLVVAPSGLTVECPLDADAQQQEELLEDLLVTIQHFFGGFTPLFQPVTELPEQSGYDERIRKPGGGCKCCDETYPDIDDKFLDILKDHTAGDPMDEQVLWTNLIPREIADRRWRL